MNRRDAPGEKMSSSYSQRNFWLDCYVAALSRSTPKEALKTADEALELCNEHWKSKDKLIPSLQLEHDYPMGYHLQG